MSEEKARRPRSRRIAAVGIAAALLSAMALLGGTFAEADQGSAKEPAGGYETLVKGVAASRALPVQFETAPVKVEFRNLVLGPGESEPIPAPTVIWMELRLGTVVTTINKESLERRPGDFWTVDKGASLTIKNPSEVAVIRAIYVSESGR
jgi:hypothetical protein